MSAITTVKADDCEFWDAGWHFQQLAQSQPAAGFAAVWPHKYIYFAMLMRGEAITVWGAAVVW